jgi:hypothetical protein
MNRFLSTALSSQMFIIFLCVSCMTAPPVPIEKINDFSTNGFLDQNHFQITVSSRPDSAAKGLVAQRESALIKARNEVQRKTVDSLAQYRFSKFISQKENYFDELYPNSNQVLRYLQDYLLKYMAYGSIYEEYFDKDNTAQIIYRIEKKDMQREIDEIVIPEFKTEKQKSNSASIKNE